MSGIYQISSINKDIRQGVRNFTNKFESIQEVKKLLMGTINASHNKATHQPGFLSSAAHIINNFIFVISGTLPISSGSPMNFISQGIGYQKHCNEFTVTRCRTVFDTSSEERCWTVYKKQCEMVTALFMSPTGRLPAGVRDPGGLGVRAEVHHQLRGGVPWLRLPPVQECENVATT